MYSLFTRILSLICRLRQYLLATSRPFYSLEEKKLFSFASPFVTKSAYKRFYFQKSFYLVPRLYRTHFFTLAKTLTSCYGLFFAMYRQWMGKSLPFGYLLAMFVSWLGQMLRYNIDWGNSSGNFFPVYSKNYAHRLKLLFNSSCKSHLQF